MKQGDINSLRIVHQTLYTKTWPSFGSSCLRTNLVTSKPVFLSLKRRGERLDLHRLVISLGPCFALGEEGEKNQRGRKKISANEACREVVWRRERVADALATARLLSLADIFPV